MIIDKISLTEGPTVLHIRAFPHGEVTIKDLDGGVNHYNWFSTIISVFGIKTSLGDLSLITNDNDIDYLYFCLYWLD